LARTPVTLAGESRKSFLTSPLTAEQRFSSAHRHDNSLTTS
jgi:hypothetical protein